MKPAFYARPVLAVARELIGCVVSHGGASGVIVETEAYDQSDPASHTHMGPTARNAAMFGPSGHAYVYRSYGIHWCLNFTCRPAGHGAGVLIRALEPRVGLEQMQQRRGGIADPRLLCSGPGRLGQALGITLAHYGLPLDRPPFFVAAPGEAVEAVVGPRIGISKGMDAPWRFGLPGSRYLSKPFKVA